LKIFYVSLIVLIVDQVSKLLVKGFSIPAFNFVWDGMHYTQTIPLIGNFLRFTYVENPGMAFGIDLAPTIKFFVSLFSVVASLILVYYIYQNQKSNLATRLGLALILGGALGNLIDRMFYGVIFGYAPLFFGHVVDFIDVDFFHFTLFGRTYDRFPIFNVADMAVSVGVFVLIIFYKNEHAESEKDDLAVLDENQDGGAQNEAVSEEDSALKTEASAAVKADEQDAGTVRKITIPEEDKPETSEAQPADDVKDNRPEGT